MGRLRLSTAHPIPSGHAYSPNYVCNANVLLAPGPSNPAPRFQRRTHNQSQGQYTITGLNRQGIAFDTFILQKYIFSIFL